MCIPKYGMLPHRFFFVSEFFKLINECQGAEMATTDESVAKASELRGRAKLRETSQL